MTPFNSEGMSFPSSPVSSLTCSCTEQIITSTPSPDLLWKPLDEVVYAWTTFGAMTMHNAALIALGTAIHAISWEQTALRHYTQAQQRRLFHRSPTVMRAVSSLLEETVHDLSEAAERWRKVVLWLNRLANAHDDPPDAGVLDTIRELFRQAVNDQHRLWTLTGQIRQEQMLLAHPDLQQDERDCPHRRRNTLMPLFHRRKASYKEQHAALPASLFGSEPTVASVAPAARSEVMEASRHNAGHSSG